MTALAAMPRACQLSRSCPVHGEGPDHVGTIASLFYLDHLLAAVAIRQVRWMACAPKIGIKLPSVFVSRFQRCSPVAFHVSMLFGAARAGCVDSGRSAIFSVEKLDKFLASSMSMIVGLRFFGVL